MTIERLAIAVEGVVQGVGFRPFVHTLAGRLCIGGFVTNRGGDVVIEAEGQVDALAAFVAALRVGPPSARIDRLETSRIAPRGDTQLVIVPSAEGSAAATIAPDVATCVDCVAEISDATERRAGYAFTSCAACGPRLTIVTSAPYDRERTTMAPFAMCAACRREYEDVADRRFHAQPIACPACGPTLALDGDARDPIARTAAAIARGELIAIKGLGGYHLACDATNAAAIAELRRRKERDAKPFAVMVADIAAARALAAVSEAEAALLGSPARPIVLLVATGAGLAAGIAPGVAELGVMLPYTPLHHLLMNACGVPLVMTSGNVTDEPIAFRDDDARARLGAIADHMLAHDRAIHLRCEDSVARVSDGAPVILRRARGYAPAPLRLPMALAQPTLALGGHLKAAFALGVGDVAYVAPHMGDLDHRSAYEAFVEGIAHLQALHRVTPVRVVHDLHPDYATTRLAETMGLPRTAVQHHHAHFASALADAGLAGRAVGACFDGAGYADDGTVWGGEMFVGDAAHVERVAHLRAVPQPGGDRAAQAPWRMAIAYLRDAGLPTLALDRQLGPRASQIAMLCTHATRTSSAGRLFDAAAALVAMLCREDLDISGATVPDEARETATAISGVERIVSYEGQAPMWLESLARSCGDTASYPVERMGPVLDTLPMIRAIVRDAERCVPAAVIARRFHTTIVELTATTCAQHARTYDLRDVVLSGGVFQNAILAAEVPARLRAVGLVPHQHRRVPPNDGGLSFGQLAVIAARDKERA